MKEQWLTEKPKWFVIDETDAWELRRPGIWKTEWSTTSGAFIALCPKMYYACEGEGNIKKGAKGISEKNMLTYKKYWDCLYDNKSDCIQNTSFRMKGSEMVTLLQRKRGLSNVHCKTFVQNDRISTCTFNKFN